MKCTILTLILLSASTLSTAKAENPIEEFLSGATYNWEIGFGFITEKSNRSKTEQGFTSIGAEVTSGKNTLEAEAKISSSNIAQLSVGIKHTWPIKTKILGGNVFPFIETHLEKWENGHESYDEITLLKLGGGVKLEWEKYYLETTLSCFESTACKRYQFDANNVGVVPKIELGTISENINANVYIEIWRWGSDGDIGPVNGLMVGGRLSFPF